MEALVGLLQLALLAAVAFTMLSSLAFGLLYRLLRARMLLLAPRERATWLFLWATGPAGLGPLLTFVCFLPSIVELVAPGLVPDHCLLHDDHHAHLCLLHPPRAPGHALGWLMLGTAGAALVLPLLQLAFRFRTSHRALRPLLGAALPDETEDLFWVPSPSPVALLAGLFKPRLILSDTLRKELSPRLLDAVVLHERAHGRRYDVVRLVLATAFSVLHLPSTRRMLLQDLRLSCEQAADSDAAAALDDPVCVADALLAVERLAQRTPPARKLLATGFGGSQLAERITELLSPVALRPRPLPRLHTVAATALCVLALSAPPLHHLAETLLSPLAR